MHTHPSLLPSNSSCSSLDNTTVSSMSMSPITNDLDDKDKQRLLKQTRKLSQILGELPREATTQPHLASCRTPAAEGPSMDLPQQHVRFSRHSFIDPPSRSFHFPLLPHSEAASTMSPRLLPPTRGALGRSSSMRRPLARPSHMSQVDLARFGLGRLRREGSTRSRQSDENACCASHLPVVAEMPARSSSLRIPNHVHQTRPKDKWRRRSIHSPITTDISTPTHSQRRSVSLWNKRRVTKDDSVHQQRITSNQGQEDDASNDEHPPLTDAQRIQRIRRGRKLTQLFGTEPPIALYKVASPFEDGPASLDTIKRERIETYLALSSSDLLSVSSGRPSMNHSHSSLSSISIASPTSDCTGHEVDPSQDSENDPTPVLPPLNFGDDLNLVAQDSHKPLLDNNDTATFRRRRLRAAKLSRFFGVAYNDLSVPIAAAAVERRTCGEEVVGVKVQEREKSWFWNWADKRADDGQDADMREAIALLRQMPRA